MNNHRPRPTFAAAAGVPAAILLAGCGGGAEEAAAPAPAPAVNAAADPAPAPAAPRKRRARKEARPKTLFALPEGAARFAVLPAEPVDAAAPEGEPGSEPAERANFTLAGDRGPADAAGVEVVRESSGDARRFEIAAVPSLGGITASPPAGFAVVGSAGAAAGGLPRRLVCETDGMTLALIPGGVVRLGDPADGGTAEDERPTVFVSSFYMDRHEVTVGQFERFLVDGNGSVDPPANQGAPDDHPALGVPWRSALLYAKWAGRSLPTEAEWERAARGDDDFRYPWGHGQPVFGRTREAGQIDRAMSFRTDRSPFGVYDLAGNAAEWTGQSWADDPLLGERPDAAGLIRDPDRGLGGGGKRAVRGGGPGWTPGRRAAFDVGDDIRGVGFRCVWRPTVGGKPGGDPLPGFGTGE